MNDPTQLAALAALVGITPETHPHLKNGYCTCGKPDCPEPLTFNLPALDTPAGDYVFLAPLMRWLQGKDLLPEVWGCATGTGDDCFGASLNDTQDFQYAETMTAALIRACQSARVPEIVAIFGEGA